MSPSPFVLIALLPFALGVCAEPGKSARGGAETAKATSPDSSARPARRESLREALLTPVADEPITTRQLSAREKLELRQQLRQQRQELLRQ